MINYIQSINQFRISNKNEYRVTQIKDIEDQLYYKFVKSTEDEYLSYYR